MMVIFLPVKTRMKIWQPKAIKRITTVFGLRERRGATKMSTNCEYIQEQPTKKKEAKP